MDRRVLILATRGRDAAIIERVLVRNGTAATVCADARRLLIEIARGAGAAVLTVESLPEEDRPALARWLAGQPSWADFPFIVLDQPHASAKPAMGLQGLTAMLGNVVVLERPINAETLSSAVASALRARDRQYQARSHWVARENDERRLRIALLAGNLAPWTCDILDRSLQASDLFKTHLGRAPSGPLGLADLIEAVHPDDRDRLRAAFAAAFELQADMALTVRVIRPDGSTRWLQMSGRTIYGDDSRPGQLSGVALDVTSRHQSEEELQRRVDEAVTQNQRAQLALVQAQKMEAVGQLTGGIAHDFNNLLTAIVGNIDLISRRAPDDRIKVMAERARQAADRAAKLTGQLLAFSRNQRLDLRPVAVDALIRDMRDLIARTIGRTVTVTTDLTVETRHAIADSNQLELAVLNLAINARDAMPDGGTLTVATRTEQRAEAEDGLGWIVVSVSDTGTGIPPDILPRVFDPFFTTKPVGKGTGLGLSQVHGIANQSGGTVKVRSVVDQGTTIEIWLRESDGRQVSVDGGGGAEDGLFVARGRVLVIDDDAAVRHFVVECLETLGLAVTQASDGRAGLERLDADKPDLLIVDFAMPGMNGAEVAAEARRKRADLPIILATGYADAGKVEAAFAQDAILRKPFRLMDLSRAVRHAMTARG